jgi:hypothetical protein
MKKLVLSFFVFHFSFFTFHLSEAQIIHVPTDYPSIQLGINAANPGDTVLVADGTYFEQINFLGKKPLMVASHFIIDGDESHISGTIIDGSQAPNLDSASVVYFISGEDTTSIICGFTIRNGKGTFSPDQADGRLGGGIFVSDAGAKIINNRITHNIIDDTQPFNGVGASGGGIATPWEENDYWLIIGNNTIDSNTCISNSTSRQAFGAGIATTYNSRIFHNNISYNSCIGLAGAVSSSGGIDCGQDAAWATPVVMIVEHNTITHNLSQSESNWANTAGVWNASVPLIFSHNLVAFNTVISGINSGGSAGIGIFNPDPGSVVSNNIFEGNASNLWTGALHLEDDGIYDNAVLVENNYFFDNNAKYGGAFTTLSVPVILQNNVFRGNHADMEGGALFLRDNYNLPLPHMAVITNNTFSSNTAGYGGAIFGYSSNHLVMNSIFWQDSANNGAEVYIVSGSVEIAFSNIDEDKVSGTGSFIPGAGNMNDDPLFIDEVYLKPRYTSPCLDQGVAEYTCSSGETYAAPQYDITGVSRPQGSGFDLGANEYQAVIHVPTADYPTIQAGIDAADPGATVLVSDGTYLEQINFKGKKPLTVASEFLTDGDTSHIINTIIDGSQALNPDSASVVYFISGEDSTSVLYGLTIQNGKGTSFFWEEYENLGGGGIYISHSAASIRHNIIKNNVLDDTSLPDHAGGCGGGIHASYGFPGWTVIENNKILNNSILSNHDWTEGGGVYSYITNVRVVNNTVTGNSSENTGYGFGAAGGVICEGSPEEPIVAVIRGNVIENNETRAVEYGYGGGLCAWFLLDGSVIQNNRISYNKNDWNGGGLDLFSASLTTFKIENNYFTGNEALNGGAIDVDYDSTSLFMLENNVFTSNTAQNQGGAIWINRSNDCPVEHMLVSINNSFYDNHAGSTGGAIYAYEDNPLIYNSILWVNPDMSGNEITVENGYTELAFSNINVDAISGDHTDGPGILNQDPLFHDLISLLPETWSPCVDAGAASFECSSGETYYAPDKDITGTPRPVGNGFDMGAYDLEKTNGIDESSVGSRQSSVVNCYPNPTQGIVDFRFSIFDFRWISLKIYDVNGREVAVVFDGEMTPGENIVTCNVQNLPSGVYYYRLTTDDCRLTTGKLVKF